MTYRVRLNLSLFNRFSTIMLNIFNVWGFQQFLKLKKFGQFSFTFRPGLNIFEVKLITCPNKHRLRKTLPVSPVIEMS